MVNYENGLPQAFLPKSTAVSPTINSILFLVLLVILSFLLTRSSKRPISTEEISSVKKGIVMLNGVKALCYWSVSVGKCTK